MKSQQGQNKQVITTNNKIIMAKEDILKKVSELIEAKEAVIFCLSNPSGSVGMHGLSYWADVVERLRKELKDVL